MSEIPISPEIWKLARAVLTQKQLVVLDLRERHGYSWNQLAITMDSTRSTAKEHHRAATRKLLNAIEAAGGDIDVALAQAEGTYGARSLLPPDPADVEKIAHAFGVPAEIVQPRPASEETPEEKTELDRLWKESA